MGNCLGKVDRAQTPTFTPFEEPEEDWEEEIAQLQKQNKDMDADNEVHMINLRADLDHVRIILLITHFCKKACFPKRSVWLVIVNVHKATK